MRYADAHPDVHAGADGNLDSAVAVAGHVAFDVEVDEPGAGDEPGLGSVAQATVATTAIDPDGT